MSGALKRLVLAGLIVVGVVLAFLFLTFSYATHTFPFSRKIMIHNSAEIENALLKLQQQKSDFLSPHLVFGISRQPNLSWNWHAGWNDTGVGYSWTQGDRTIEISKVGDILVYSISVRWSEDKSAGPVASEIETNVSPPLSGDEIYATPEAEYKRLKNFLATNTPDVALDCKIKKDSTGRIVSDMEYLDGTFSLPQKKWADFIQSLFSQVYQSKQPIYMEQTAPGAFFN
jgi:hypothetical protein